MTIKLFTLIMLIFLGSFVSNISAQSCNETGSYNKEWTLQERFRESGRERRLRALKKTPPEKLAVLGDRADSQPTLTMFCGMGFSNGLAKIFVNRKAGFINLKGKIVVAPKYKDAGRFSQNLAPVQFENGKWGYIDKSGKIAVKPIFDWALMFREGLALIQIGEKWGYINLTGKIVIKPQFAHANSFSEGLAHAQIYTDQYYSGYIDKTGKWVLKPTFNSGEDFVKGEALVGQDVRKDGKFYSECFSIDKSGKRLDFVEGCDREIKYPSLLDSNATKLFFKNYKTGYKTRAGKIIWKPTS